MANNGESWFIKLGVLFDGTGFKKFGIAAFDVKKTITGLYDSFKKVSAMGGDLSRTSRYLDISSDRLQVWERAFGLLGGSAEDARSAINSLNFAFDKLRLGQGGELATTAARLRLRPEDLTSFETMIEALNRSYNTYFKDNYGQFKVLAEQMGLSKSAILLVTQSAEEYQKTMLRASSIPILNQRHLKTFESLEKRSYIFSKRFDIFKAQTLSSIAPSLDRILDKVEKLFSSKEMNESIANMSKKFEEFFNALTNTENLESFSTLLEATVTFLTKMIELIAKVPEATGWLSDKLGALYGYVTRDSETSRAIKANEEKFKKMQESGLLDENLRPIRKYDVDKSRIASGNISNANNVTLNQTNNFNGKADSDMVDEIAEKTASAINSYNEQQNINNRKTVSVY